MDGLVVRMRPPTVREALEWNKLGHPVETAEVMAGLLVSWNLDDDEGQPVPCDANGLLSQPIEFMRAILLAMQQNILGVSPPLSRPSSDGSQSLEVSLPMEAL